MIILVRVLLEILLLGILFITLISLILDSSIILILL